jgi:hypothetical protein
MERAAKSAASLIGRLFGPALRFALLLPAVLVLCVWPIQTLAPLAIAGSAAELAPVVVALVRLTLVTETRTRGNFLATAVGFMALFPAVRAAVLLLSG